MNRSAARALRIAFAGIVVFGAWGLLLMHPEAQEALRTLIGVK